ncbi:MAG: O-antigen ligase family protein [Candidatus Cloacimonetes bacterium]|nr:O-antigen ligase family protein [Candidatus Cloacimonadota bacterium]
MRTLLAEAYSNKFYMLVVIIVVFFTIGIVFHFEWFLTLLIMCIIITLLFVNRSLLWGLIIFGLALLSSINMQFDTFFHFNTTIILLFILVIKYSNELLIVNIKPNKNILLFLAIYVFLIYTLSYSSDQEFGMMKLKKFILSTPFFIITFLVFKNQFKSISTIFRSAFIIGLCYLFFVITYPDYSYFPRLTTLHINPIWFSRFLGMIFIIGVFFIRWSKKIHFKLSYFTAILFMLFFMIRTGSRGPILSLAVSLLFVYIIDLFKQKRFNLKLFLMILSTIMIIAIMLYIASSFLPEDIKERLLSKGRDVQNSSLVRVLLAVDAINLFKSNLILGVGLGGFTKGVLGNFKYPHNIFLELLSEMGIIGTIFFSSIFIYASFKFSRIIKKYGVYSKGYEVGMLLLTIFIFTFINAQFSGSIDGNMYLWFSIGGVIFYSTWDGDILNENLS